MKIAYRIILMLPLGCVAAPVAAQTPPEAKSVTTTWLPDPFPNAPPKALERRAVVELDAAGRTPSVLLGVYDVENDPLEVASFAQPKHGSAELNPDGTFTYTPQRDFVGSDALSFKLRDGRGGESSATMHVSVIRPTGRWATTSFTGLSEIEAAGQPLDHGRAAVVPRVVDWDHDGKLDLLIGARGAVWLYRNDGTLAAAQFAKGVRLQVGGEDIQLGAGRMSIAWTDIDRDGNADLVVTAEQDRKIRCYPNTAALKSEPQLAAAVVLKARDGQDFVAADVRTDVADWNGDNLPDVIVGSRSGQVQVAYNVGTAAAPVLAVPTAALDCDGRKLGGSYNLNVRVTDVNQDGTADLVESYNWGTLQFHINAATPQRPLLSTSGRFDVSGPDFSKVDLHALTDGPLVDLGDFNGDGTSDLVLGAEAGGKVRLALGLSGQSYLDQLEAFFAAHPRDLGSFLADPAETAAAKSRLQSVQGALHEYVASLASPSQKREIARGLTRLIATYPQYFEQRQFDPQREPGMAALAAQTWLTLLMVSYHDPEARKSLADAAGFTGGYRKLVEEIGLIYIDNSQNPRGAEAIYQWVRTIPREIYPGTGITVRDWLGDRSFLAHGHFKNTFKGSPIDPGEYAFGSDALAVIGDRGNENQFMTVVHHEACHDLDAYVRRFPDLDRRWGQMLVMAGGPDMRADPATSRLSLPLTQAHFRQAGLWNGEAGDWDAAWKKYWATPPGVDWREFGFMRGNIDWFYGATQESLATQGNQYFNSTEGRLQVAVDRWRRGFRSNLTEVLFFLDIWSLGLDKMKFYENDTACNQTISFAQVGRNPQGYIDRLDLGDRLYQFVVNAEGVATEIVHAPAPNAADAK